VFRTTVAVVAVVLIISLGLGVAIGGRLGGGSPRPAAPMATLVTAPGYSSTGESAPSWYVPSTLLASPSPFASPGPISTPELSP
jgi:hypothetical protein